MARTCTRKGCDLPHKANGLCKKHYKPPRRKKSPHEHVRVPGTARAATRLTPELADALVATVEGTRLFDAQVAISNGVHPQVLREWLKKGLAPNAPEPYCSFAERYARAQIQTEEQAVQEVRAGCEPSDRDTRPGDWKAAAWWLERKFPKRWNPQVQTPGAPVDAVDVEELIRQSGEQGASLLELFREPPPELVEAMKAARDEILAVLTPALVDPTKSAG